VVSEFLEAGEDREMLRKWTNTALAEVWETKGGGDIDISRLLTRAESYGPNDLPLGVEVILAGVDVQPDRLEVQFVGHGLNGELWVIAYGILHGDPNDGFVWRELEETLVQPLGRVDGRQMFCRAAAIDSGGYNTAAVYDFCAAKRITRPGRAVSLFATKGSSVASSPIWDARPKRSHSGKPLHIVGVSAAKECVMAWLGIEPNADGSPTPNCIHFPQDADIDEKYFAQLTSEYCETRFRFGVASKHWILPPGKKNEALDTFILAFALRGMFRAQDCARLSGITSTAPAATAERVNKRPNVAAENYEGENEIPPTKQWW
jgi:phage terminase large subunit GpA-like protein